MSRPFQPLSRRAGDRMRERSLEFWQDAFHAAEALADARLEEVADFACRAEPWRVEHILTMAALAERAYEAERSRRQAHVRLLREFLEYVRADRAGEAAP